MEKEEIKKWFKKNTWFEKDDEDPTMLSFVTREHGNVGTETHGEKDWQEAKRVVKLLESNFFHIDCEIEPVDEWVHIFIYAEE